MVETEEINESQLINDIVAGDKGKFRLIVQRYQASIYNLAYRMTGDAAIAEDITQETLINIYKGLRKFRKEASLATWIRRIALNQCLTYRRSDKSRLHDSLNGDDESEGSRSLKDKLANSSPDPSDQAYAKQIASHINQALQKLSHEYRAIIIMRDIQGMEYKELEEALQLPSGTVKSRLSRARNELKEILTKMGVRL